MSSRKVTRSHSRPAALGFNGPMDANAALRQALETFYAHMGRTTRDAAALVRIPNVENAEALRAAMLSTLGSIDQLNAALPTNLRAP